MTTLSSKLLEPQYKAIIPDTRNYLISETTQFHTQVTRAASGVEQRSARWANNIRRVVLDTGERPLLELDRLVNFFNKQKGRLSGFLWSDPHDKTNVSFHGQEAAERPPMKKLSSNGQVWALMKRYRTRPGPEELEYSRRVFAPINRTVRLYNGTSFISNSTYSVDYGRGVIIFSSAKTYKEGTLRAAYSFLHPMRFDTDSLELQKLSDTTGRIAEIPMIEILQNERPLSYYSVSDS